MPNLIHDSFLAHIHNTAQDRLSNYAVWDSYYNGDQDVDIPKKVKAALESELGTINNYSRLVVDMAVDYIMGGGVNLEAVENEDAEEALREVYDNNGLLTEEMMKALTISGKKGDVFLKLFIEDEKEIKVRVLRPDIVFPRYKSDDYMEMIYCAVKWFELPDDFSDDNNGGVWKAQVFRPDVVEWYELSGDKETQHTTWELVDSEENILGFIPIIHIKNTIDDLEFGVSDLQVMTDLQDALNKTITDMLLTMDNQAFQRVIIFGGQSKDEIVLEPGKILEVPNEEASAMVVEAADITGFLEGMRQIISEISTVTQVPFPNMARAGGGIIPESGFAARLHYLPLEMKADRKMAVIERRFAELDQMIFAAMKLLGQGDYSGTKTKLHFRDGLPIDQVSLMEVHEKELVNKIKSRRTMMQERQVEDVDAELALIEVEDAGISSGGSQVD